MTTARFDGAVVIFSVSVVFRGGVLPVPQTAEHIGMVDATMFKCDEHFVIHFRQEVHAAVLPGHRRRDPRPITLDLITKPGKSHLDSVHVVRIAVIGDYTYDYPVE